MNIYLRLQSVSITTGREPACYWSTVGFAAGESRDNLIYIDHRYNSEGFCEFSARIKDYRVCPFTKCLEYMLIETIYCPDYIQIKLFEFGIEKYVHTVEPYLAVDILAHGWDKLAEVIKIRMLRDGISEDLWNRYRELIRKAKDCGIGHFKGKGYGALLLEAGGAEDVAY